MFRSLAASPIAVLTALVITFTLTTAHTQEVIVMSGPDELVSWLKAEKWWGEAQRGEQLKVPHAMLTGISPRWRETAQKMTVQQKKEIFYRLMLPLVVHANDLVLARRAELEQTKQSLEAGQKISAEEIATLTRAATLLRILDADAVAKLGAESDNLLEVIDEALYKLDVIPAGLVLGQAAYESGYGTSRFAAEGNALFGQWTYGGKGLVPEQQRKQLGDHRIASYEWPFDSVRGYFINLSSHPAYEDFRRLRADLKAAGKPLSSMALADGLIRYSERGQEYVDTLKGMIRVNRLAVADDAEFRDEPIRFLVGTNDGTTANEMRREVEVLRASGELAKIISRMRLE